MFTDHHSKTWPTVSPIVTWTPLQARHALNGSTMGTRYSVVFTAPADLDLRPLAGALQLAVDGVDRQMSNWQPTSDLSRFNAAETGIWVAVAADLLEVVETGLEIGRMSGSAFHIGMGQLVDAWGFGPSRSCARWCCDCEAVSRQAAQRHRVARTGPAQCADEKAWPAAARSLRYRQGLRGRSTRAPSRCS